MVKEKRVPGVIQAEQRKKKLIKMWRENRENGFVCKSPGMGRGLFAQKNIPSYTLVGEYVGKQSSGASARRFLNDPPSVYCFFWREDGKMLMRDAESSKRNIRYMNHSLTNPNCKIVKISIDGEIHPLMVTIKSVAMGDQLLWDYNDKKKDIVDDNDFLLE